LQTFKQVFDALGIENPGLFPSLDNSLKVLIVLDYLLQIRIEARAIIISSVYLCQHKNRSLPVLNHIKIFQRCLKKVFQMSSTFFQYGKIKERK